MPWIRNCWVCGTEFVTDIHDKRSCSDECKATRRKKADGFWRKWTDAWPQRATDWWSEIVREYCTAADQEHLVEARVAAVMQNFALSKSDRSLEFFWGLTQINNQLRVANGLPPVLRSKHNRRKYGNG